MLDLGGESTRPGAARRVRRPKNCARLLPVLKALARCSGAVSVDTLKPAVMRAALAEGAGMINDINALRAPGALDAVAASDAAVCLMHMQGEPAHHAAAIPRYGDVVREVKRFLPGAHRRVRAARHRAGAHHRRSGLRLRQDAGAQSRPAAPSATSSRAGRAGAGGLVAQVDARQRSPASPRPSGCAASVAAALLAAQRGATIVRVHDVAATRDALAVLAAVEGKACQ